MGIAGLEHCILSFLVCAVEFTFSLIVTARSENDGTDL